MLPLEREKALTDTQNRRNFVITPSTRVFESIPKPASSVRVAPNTHFLVRMATADRDPQTLIHLQPLKATKKDREITLITYKQSLIPFGGIKHNRADDNTIAVEIKKVGTGSLEIIPQSPLPPGEYAFVTGHEAQCFGVDAGDGTDTAAGTPTADKARSAAPPPPPPPPPAHPPSSALETPPGAPGYPALHALGPAMDGCWWTPWVSQRHSLEMLVQRCEPKHGFGGVNTIFEDSAEGVTVRPENDPKPMLLFAVHTKPPAQTLAAAVREQFFARQKLTPAKKAACRLKEDQRNPQDAGPLESYSVVGPCDALESNDAFGRSFLYAPTESRTKFLFAEIEDAWPFDQSSIRFLPEP